MFTLSSCKYILRTKINEVCFGSSDVYFIPLSKEIKFSTTSV